MSDPYRTMCERQHRIFGCFLAQYAWLRGVDCLGLSRDHFETYFNLRRFSSERLNWIWQDIRPWWPHHRLFWKVTSTETLHSVFVSRVPLTKRLFPDETASIFQRVAVLQKKNVRAENFRLPKMEIGLPSPLRETELIGELAKTTFGFESPADCRIFVIPEE